MKKTFLTTCLLVIVLNVSAQHVYFIENGRIEYEKKVNMYVKIKELVNKTSFFTDQNYEEYKRANPQFATSLAILDFSSLKSTYQPKEETTTKRIFMSDPWATLKNNIQTDFKTDSTTTLRNLYDEEYIVKDKKREILWKITNETREIAGFQCRRANGLIMDSVYVVAFYTDEILTSGGPESFSGLPGMILGVALPHDNVTWFATKVEINTLNPPNLKLPRKAKAMTRKEFEESVSKLFSGRGQRNMDAIRAIIL